MSLDVHEGKAKYNLVGYTEGPFLLLDQTTFSLVNQRRDLVECLKSYRIGWALIIQLKPRKTIPAWMQLQRISQNNNCDVERM